MMEIILAGVVSLVITLAAGKLLIPALIRLKAGQSIKEVGPTWHKGKQGTPTMGGLMFIIGIGIAILILGWKGMLEGNFTHLYVYVFALVFGVITRTPASPLPRSSCCSWRLPWPSCA